MLSSTIISKTPQADGSLSVHERHTDHTGAVFDRAYMAAPTEDLAVRLAANAASIDTESKLRDMRQSVFGASWAYTRTHASRTELNQYVRDLYHDSDKETLARVALRVLEWADNGVITDEEARVVAGMTVEQWDMIKTKMRALVAAYGVIQTAVGE